LGELRLLVGAGCVGAYPAQAQGAIKIGIRVIGFVIAPQGIGLRVN
tara:strand:- start:2235 stop:2372 length:138 start_codon:yes stop_codon:yes gene_type:complete